MYKENDNGQMIASLPKKLQHRMCLREYYDNVTQFQQVEMGLLMTP